MTRYWISWHQPTEDHRPLAYPPGKEILGWWCSGYDSNDVAILCALVKADSESLARSAVEQDWPEAERWRFATQVDESWRPGDRFPLNDWMQERILAEGAAR